MEKIQLLIISKNRELICKLEDQVCPPYDLTSVKSIHAGYPLALSYLPDLILIDFASLDETQVKALKKFKSTHFLNKSFLFLLAKKENRRIINKEIKDFIDCVIYDTSSVANLNKQIENFVGNKRSLTNYWKDSFMGLFNLMNKPVILLQNENVVAMNDSFRRDFYMTHKNNFKLTELVLEKNRPKVRQAIHRFVNGKHMKTSTTVNLLVNNRKREAKVRLSKLDKDLRGQMIMLIDFQGKENLLDENIGSFSNEAEKGFGSCTVQDQSFTKREKEVIDLLCRGYKTKEISEALCISSKTIEKHRANIVRRTNSGTILESVVYALNHKLIDI